jgi:hypothetical protein
MVFCGEFVVIAWWSVVIWMVVLRAKKISLFENISVEIYDCLREVAGCPCTWNAARPSGTRSLARLTVVELLHT